MGEVFMTYHPDPLIRNYDDRGMAKWIGFYLSEHTSEMEKDKGARNKVWDRKEPMTELEIGEVIDKAYGKHSTVIIQTSELDLEGYAFEDIIGSIEAIQDNNLYVQSAEYGLRLISIDSINNIQFDQQLKLSAI